MYPTAPTWTRRRRAVAGICFLLIAVLASAMPAHADVAPPDEPPGANPLPGSETTQVRMVAETVLLDVQRRSGHGAEGEVSVQADFLMRNLSPVEEQLEVRFPLTFWDGSSDGFGNFPEIRDLKVFVDGGAVPTRRAMIPATSQFAEQVEVPWAVFPVGFPPGEDVRIRVTYAADGIGEAAFVAFKYVLETGAGWSGTIGSADLVVRLPYEANEQNVIFDESTGYSQTTPGGVIEGREVRWHYDDLEPTYEHNLEISLAKPEAWEQVLLERERVKLNPRDGEAWGRLGKAYKELVRFRRGYRQDDGGQELYRLSIEAYERSLTLLPQDALWHLGFADLLFQHYYWDVYMAGNQDTSEIVRAVQEIRQAYTLDPDDERIISLLDEIMYGLPGAVARGAGGYDFPILTSTPEPGSAFFPAPYATSTTAPTLAIVAATITPGQPESGATPTPTSPTIETTPAPSVPFCGSGGVGLSLLVIVPRLRLFRSSWRRPRPKGGVSSPNRHLAL